VLARRVGGDVGLADLGSHRCHHHDPSVTRDAHPGDGPAQAPKRRSRIEVEHALPIGIGHLVDPRGVPGAGVRDENLDRTPRTFDLVDEVVDRVTIGDVGRQRQSRPVTARRNLGQVVLMDSTDEFGITDVAIFLARCGYLAQWNLDALISELAGRPVTATGLRAEFRGAAGSVPEEVGVTWRRRRLTAAVPAGGAGRGRNCCSYVRGIGVGCLYER
jgi:hypothetical protein